jgi:hypothetical protein
MLHHLQLTSHIGQDGMLQIPLPIELRNCEVEAVLVIQQRTPAKKSKCIFGAFRGQIVIHDDFSEPLPDSFWLGEK